MLENLDINLKTQHDDKQPFLIQVCCHKKNCPQMANCIYCHLLAESPIICQLQEYSQKEPNSALNDNKKNLNAHSEYIP